MWRVLSLRKTTTKKSVDVLEIKIETLASEVTENKIRHQRWSTGGHYTTCNLIQSYFIRMSIAC